MYQIIELDTLESVMAIVTEQEYNPQKQRYRSPYVYRGLSKASFNLTTSLQRNCKHLYTELEASILRSFTKYAITEDPTLHASVWKQMILGQHHGLPTRLLDWTYSPLTALHFAMSQNNLDKMEKNDCVIWKINIDEIHELLPKKYSAMLDEENAGIFTVEMLQKIVDNTEQYDKDMKDRAMVVIEPPSIDPRIINQYSYFSIIPSGMKDIEEFLNTYTNDSVKYVIKKELRWRIRDMLDQLNINERIVYPGLDGLSQWLARHYYVKPIPEQKENTP
ncbi:MAG: FRG domain-containing protein [Clostridia bacterium]|nr:FRG domain-containing protein [Clostridia bacterium]